jgi:hypothetical protein
MMRPAHRWRLLISGLVALGLLLLPAAPTLAMTPHQPDAVQSSHKFMLSVAGHHDCADTSCMPDAATGNDCCQGTGCAWGLFIPVAQAIAPHPSTQAQYWTRSSSGIGLTPEPDIGPPISLA